MEGDAIRYPKNINIGIAVALDWGLIVPVIKQAEEKSFLGIARAIADLAERARGEEAEAGRGWVGHVYDYQLLGSLASSLVRRLSISRSPRFWAWAVCSRSPTVVTDEDGTDSIAIRRIVRSDAGI